MLSGLEKLRAESVKIKNYLAMCDKHVFGKIAKIDDAWRKQFIFEMSSKHNICSLGRFGTWRNLLLDDVLQDISVLKKLMNTTTYDRSRHAAK